MKKKIFSAMLCAAMVVSLAGCSGSSGNAQSGTTTTAPQGTSTGDTTGAGGTEVKGGNNANGGNTETTLDGEIKIGVVAPISGSMAMVGDTNIKGVRLAAKQINENGGINGKKITLVEADDQGDPKSAVSAANKVIFNDGVVGIIGTTNSSCTLAMMDVTESNQIPTITPNSSGISITDPSNSYIARLQASDTQMARAITEYAVKDLGYTKIAIMYQNDDLGAGGKEVAKEVLKENGLEAVAVEAFEPSATDMNAQLAKIKTFQPEAIILWTMYTPAAAIAKQVQQLGMDVDLMGGGGLTNAKLFELGGDAAVGILNTQTFFPDKTKASAAAGAFIDAYEAEYGVMPDSNAAMAYDSMMVMAEGLKAAPDLKPDDIMAGIKSVSAMDMATGTITMDENGDANREILIIRLAEGGKYELVK